MGCNIPFLFAEILTLQQEKKLYNLMILQGIKRNSNNEMIFEHKNALLLSWKHVKEQEQKQRRSSDPLGLYVDVMAALILRQHCLGIPSTQSVIRQLITTPILQCHKPVLHFVMNNPSNIKCRARRMKMTTSVSFTPYPIDRGLESHFSFII